MSCPLGPWPPLVIFGAICDSARSHTVPRYTRGLLRLLTLNERLASGSGYKDSPTHVYVLALWMIYEVCCSE